MKNLDLEKSNINKIFWSYTIPSIIMMIMQSTAGVIDSIFIGKYVGAEGLSALTIIVPILILLSGLSIMISVGGCSIAGIEKGAKNIEKSNNIFNITITLSLISGVLGAVTIYSIVPLFARLINLNEIIFNYTVDYSTYTAVFTPFYIINFALYYFLKLDSKPNLATFVTLMGTILNIVLDYIFIVKFNLKLVGAAIATGISQVVPSIIYLIIIIFNSSWKLKIPKFYLNEIKQIFFNGISEFLDNISLSVTGIIFNFIIMLYIGNDGISAYSVALQFSQIVTAIGYGIAEGNQTALSYNFGAKNYKRVSKLKSLSIKFSIISGFILFLITMVYSNEISKTFINDKNIINLSSKILKYSSISYIFLIFNMNISTYYTSINDSINSAIITIYRSLISPIISVLILPIIIQDYGIWLSNACVEITTFIMCIIILRKFPFGKKFYNNLT